MITRTQNTISFLAGRWPLDPSKPTFIFIHGSGQQGIFWQAQVDGLVDVANTIALDLPGHGSSGGGGFCRIADYARVVEAFIEAVKAPRPIPCGLSMGGAITLHLLIYRGGGLRAGILANTGVRLKVLPAIIETIERDFEAHLKSIVGFTVAPANQSDTEICRLVLASVSGDPAVAADDFRACNAFDESDRAAGIQLPVLVLSADQDILTPVKYGDWLAAAIAGARHVTIGNAGHMSPIEQPEAFNAAIRGFLTDLEA